LAQERTVRKWRFVTPRLILASSQYVFLLPFRQGRTPKNREKVLADSFAVG
jgi:hypothetical protein